MLSETSIGQFENSVPTRPIEGLNHSKLLQLSLLSVIQTRRKSDEIFSQVLPPLANKLAQGTLTLEDLTKISDSYFSSKTSIISSLGKPSFLPPTNTINLMINGLRQKEVSSGNSFFHPDWKILPQATSKLVEQLNLFVDQADQLTPNDVKLKAFQFYLLFTELHLPIDGSGRFVGDLDLVTQMALHEKMQSSKKLFPITPISSTGYRLANLETTMEVAQTLFEGFITQNIINQLSEEQIDKTLPAFRKFNYTLTSATDTQLKEIYSLLKSNPKLKKIFSEKLSAIMLDFINNINTPNNDLQNIARSISIKIEPRLTKSVNHYSSSKDLLSQGVNLDLIDHLVAIHRYYEQGLQGSNMEKHLLNIKKTDLTETTIPLLQFLLRRLQKEDIGVYNRIQKKNKWLKRLISKPTH